MPQDLSSIFFKISNQVSRGGLSVDECLGIVRNNRELVDELLTAVFIDRGLSCGGREAFTVLDACKSLIVRKLSLDRRNRAMGFPDADLYLGLAALSEDIDRYLLEIPGYTLCSLYLGPNGEVSCIFAYSDPKSRQPVYRFVKVVDRGDAPHFAQELDAFVKSTSNGQPDFRILDSILGKLGATIIPALRSGQRLILIPHRLLHLLPLHCMHMNVGVDRIYVDEVVDSISYSSSVAEMYSPRMVAGPEGFVREELPRLLVVLDMAATDLAWLEFEATYYEGLRQGGLPVDIVRSLQELPQDLSLYIWITWAGHAQSNPTDWGRSILRLGNRDIPALEIASEWMCPYRPWVLLGACQTSVDASEIRNMDEYCGLDLAFYIAGAFGVYSTMWPVWDAMAGFGDVFLTNQIIGGRQDPPKALARMQQRLRRGDWKAGISGDISRLSPGLQETVRRMRGFPDDAFRSISDWGVFRSYGVS
jgi:hypothetical protein